MRAAAARKEIPDTYGDFDAEYAALTQGCAQVDLAGGVVDITGEDAAAFLHGQLSADVAALQVGHAVETLVLSPRGRLVGVGHLLRFAPDAFRLVLGRDEVDAVVEALNRFRIRVQVEITSREGGGVWQLAGPGAAATPLVVEAHIPGEGCAFVVHGGQLVLRTGGPALGAYVVVSDAGELTIGGAAPAGRLAVDSRRVELCIPVFGVDYDAGTIPHDAGLVPRAVSLDKGCYTGQELIERIHSRGHANRCPRSIRLETDKVPEPGAEVVVDDKTVGVLTTTAQSPAWESAAGLGLVRVEVEPGATVQVAGVRGTVMS